jgi:HAD superfamily hydrolase (TIGR01490 family)
LVRWQLYHAIADKLVSLGFIAPVKLQEIKSARMTWKRREAKESFKEYEMKLVGLYDALLSEISVEQFEQTAEAVFSEYKDQVYTYTRDLLASLKAQGYLLFAISGSQTQIVSKIAEYYGLDDFVGRVDEHANGRFTGNSTTPVFTKDEVLQKLVKKHHTDFKKSIAVGDSHSDIAMLKLVEQPTAFNPEASLFEYARKQGWKIVLERKNMIYELESINGQYQLVKTNAG